MTAKSPKTSSPPTPSFKKEHKNSSYHSSLDSHLFIPGVGHVAPDTFSGYGSFLDSDNEGDSEVTSAFYLQQNTVVGDSLAPDPVACVEEMGKVDGEADLRVFDTVPTVETSRSGEMSPSSKKFFAFAEKVFDSRRKKAKKRV
ncbi:hypothetical protein RND81_01G178300 [Saponaria officinalis]|uniref:Uncharacterized protein n=1 Tax=Saponaria officinalis TaxID=3572 RepID=A0AAW1NGH0_SAPOF